MYENLLAFHDITPILPDFYRDACDVRPADVEEGTSEKYASYKMRTQ
jgi:hypothetical protein